MIETSSKKELVVVYTAENNLEADSLKGLLEAEGIKVVIHDYVSKLTAVSMPGMNFRYDLLVPKESESKARAILEEKSERLKAAPDKTVNKYVLRQNGKDINLNREELISQALKGLITPDDKIWHDNQGKWFSAKELSFMPFKVCPKCRKLYGNQWKTCVECESVLNPRDLSELPTYRCPRCGFVSDVNDFGGAWDSDVACSWVAITGCFWSWLAGAFEKVGLKKCPKCGYEFDPTDYKPLA